jgi:2-polyprenyl-3-methyl-5-hydroxy-6-metoxy-1,4-benzoquinol methylase
MPVDPLSDEKIIDSWLKNAEPWTTAVRQDQIESRRLVTNRAIVDVVLARRPRTALDIGCGEGWLSRALTEQGVDVVGVDVVPELIERARQGGGGDFRVASYEDIAAGTLNLRVDAAVANFSLIGSDSVSGLIARAPGLLTPGGVLIIQTLHPIVACGEEPYRDGWRSGSWAGFSDDFTDPAPWYFRTLESWVQLLVESGLRLTSIHEPLHPGTGKAASIIFVAQAAG